MTELTNRAPESIRRANSRAQERRKQWRERYAVISDLIRESRGEKVRQEIGAAKADMRLRALRSMADTMLAERYALQLQLRGTSYKWV